MKRAKILLFADHSCNNWKKYTEIAEILESSSSTVSIICRQYSLNGLKYVLSARPKVNRGRVIKITEEVELQLTSLINGEPPEGQRRWTLKLLARELVKAGVVESISKVAIHKYLKKQIKP